MKKSIIFMILIGTMALCLCSSVVADQTVIPISNNTTLSVSNNNGARFDDYNNDTYMFFNGSANGLSAIKMTDSSATVSAKVVNTNLQSGTFYILNNGSKNYNDNTILMLAVNGTIPDNFRIHIISSGYQWVPLNGAPSPSIITYNATAIDEIFTKSDFIYGPQTWRPYYTKYPIFEGQNVSNSANTFSIMFIDLYAGILKYNNSLMNNGMLKVQYEIENLPYGSMAAFNAYAYSKYGNQQNIAWTNSVNAIGETAALTSGYTVNGTAPIARFSADTPTNGSLPLTVTFIDQSTGTPTSWLWDFGDGITSNLHNPTHTYTTAGNYTVTLTAINSAGNSTVTKANYITVLKSNVIVQITPSKTNPQVGDKVTYTFKLGNSGPGIAKDVVFTYVIPDGVSFAGAHVDQGNYTYNETTRTLTWNLGDVGICDPYLWLDLNILRAGSFNINPGVTVAGVNIGSEGNIGSLLVNAVLAPTSTVNAAINTIPLQSTGIPVAGLIMSLLLVGSGLALGKRK